MQHLLTQPASRTSRPPIEKGQGLVELAIIIPFLVIIVVGLLDLGRAYFSVIIINNAAREGVRYLSVHRSDKGTVGTCDYTVGSVPFTYNGTFSQTKCAALAEAQGTIVRLTASDVTATCTDNDAPSDGKCDSGFPYSYPAVVTVRTTFNPIFWPGVFTFSRTAKMLVP